MSRIGKKPILIPQGVEVKIDGHKVTVRGPKGEISKEFRPEVDIVMEDNKIAVKVRGESKLVKSLWGLTRALIFNMVNGVVAGYEKKLEIEGVGFKANIEGDSLVLNMGFSHPVKVKGQEGIKFLVEKNVITVSGTDKGSVGQMAAKIRDVKPPEPYKGKGIRYQGEQIRRKLGKKAVATAK
ncbi:MAG: 50S ribosomal protein L6 [Candidatus Nealsonbacteria bacterium]|nr:50S ribosomal protein L6 [Candidatus Nealsonbacteria bacterium]